MTSQSRILKKWVCSHGYFFMKQRMEADGMACEESNKDKDDKKNRPLRSATSNFVVQLQKRLLWVLPITIAFILEMFKEIKKYYARSIIKNIGLVHTLFYEMEQNDLIKKNTGFQTHACELLIICVVTFTIMFLFCSSFIVLCLLVVFLSCETNHIVQCRHAKTSTLFCNLHFDDYVRSQ